MTSVLILTGLLVLTTACQLYQPSLNNLRVGSQVDEKTKEVIVPQYELPPQTEVIFSSVYLKNAAAGTKLRASWQWEGHALGEPTEIDASGSRYAAFSVQRPRDGWRSGNYTVTIEIPDTDQKLSADFMIE